MTAVGSAKAAGYSGDADSIRQAGSRAAKSTAVMALVELAQIEQAGGDDGTLSGPEARRICPNWRGAAILVSGLKQLRP